MDMVTNTRLVLELEADRPEVPADWLSQFFQRASKRAGQLRCGITGHTVLLRYTPTRLSLQCTACGYESPGWELEPGIAAISRTVAVPGQLIEPERSSCRAPARIGPPVAA
jgi:hypothetical protein